MGTKETGHGGKELMQTNRTFEAKIQNLPLVMEFLEATLNEAGAEEGECFDIQLAVDELFTNIALYAYDAHVGVMELDIRAEQGLITITITDSGKPFDPLTLPPPDITSDLDERRVGGLGIHLVREVTDTVTYARREGRNILTIKKRINSSADSRE